MTRLLLLLAAVLLLASSAGAQTTTSTSTSTSTSLAPGASWSCTIDYKSVQPMFYETVGHCTSTGSYTTSGGDALGSAATAAASAAALCGSGNNSLVMVLTTQSPGGAVIPATCGFDMTTWKYKCSQQATASASTAMIESTMTSVVMSPFKFLAICK